MSGTAAYGLSSAQRKHGLNWWYLPVAFLSALAGMVLATQHVAAIFGYQAALGSPWFMAFNRPWYAPWKVFEWHAFAAQYPETERAEFLGMALFLAMQFIILGAVFVSRKPRGISDLHGSAHWAGEGEIEDAGLFNGRGVYIGGWIKRHGVAEGIRRLFKGLPYHAHKYLRHDGPEHILMYAPTRSGKGVGVILPTLLSWLGSVVVLDIKGENWAISAGWRKSQGHRVMRFDPADASGTGSCFNPLEEVRLDSLNAIRDIQNIAMMIMDPEGKGLQDYWAKAGFAFIGGALMHCMIMIRATQKRHANLNDLCKMLADPNRDVMAVLDEMLETDHASMVKDGGEFVHEFIAGAAREMKNKSDNERSGVLGMATSNLALYRDPIVAMNIEKSDFRVVDLLHHDDPVSLYLVVGVDDINRVKPLLRLMLNLFINGLCGRMEFENGVQKKPQRRLLMLLDEFPSIGKMEIVDKSIAFAAGYGISYLLIIQNIEQLNKEYGKDNGIKGNCHTRIAYAPNTLDTAKELSEMTGKTTVVEHKASLSGSRSGFLRNTSVSVSETARPLLTPDECMRLPGIQEGKDRKAKKPGDMLIFVAGRSPVYGRQILWFKDPVFLERGKIAPPAQSDSLCPQPGPAPAAPEVVTSPDGESLPVTYAEFVKKNAQ